MKNLIFYHEDCGCSHGADGDDAKRNGPDGRGDCGHGGRGHGENCGCGRAHAHEDHCGCDDSDGGCDCADAGLTETQRRLVLDTRGSVSLCGIAGALVDLGAASYDELAELCDALGLSVPQASVDVVRGCSGIRIEAQPGEKRDASWIAERIDLLKRQDAEAGALTEQIYHVIAATQEEEQGTENADLGSFAREDVFTLYVLISAMLTRTETDGLSVTPVELGCGEFGDGETAQSAPASLTTRFLEGLLVTSTRGVRGIDVPSAALVASCTVEQSDEAEGLLGACGYGLDGEAVTRIYLLE